MQVKKKNKQFIDSVTKTPFYIPQFEKVKGLRKKSEVKTVYVSGIYGTMSELKNTAPFENFIEGDLDKKFGQFRVDKKFELTDEDFGPLILEAKDRYKFTGEPKPVSSSQDGVDILKPIFSKSKIITKEAETNPFLEVNIVKPTPDMQPQETFFKPEEKKFEESKPKDPQLEVFKEIIAPTIVPGSNVFEKAPEFDYDQLSSGQEYKLPPISMFSKKKLNLTDQPEWLKEHIESINHTLEQFDIEGSVVSSIKGPSVTRYELSLAPGVKVQRVVNIADNIQMNLSAKSIRIEAPIPGKNLVGIEVPNQVSEVVYFGNVVDDPTFYNSPNNLKVALGVDIDGSNIYADIDSMPHCLIAGTTNSGKSVCVNTILVSLLVKNKPDDLKLLLIDPKVVELSPYNGLPHLITPVITDPKLASEALFWCVEEMERRYQIYGNSRSKDIRSFNDNIKRGIISQEKQPYIVIIIDELAELMMVASKQVEDSIQRLTQKGRACGIHLIVATQRPTTDVVKGTIKANLPFKIAFKVTGFVDSTTIINESGAEKLLGKGDMLVKGNEPLTRLQGAYIQEDEIFDCIDFIKVQSKPNYLFNHESLNKKYNIRELQVDELFADVAHYILRENVASSNIVMKEFNIGFNRSQKIFDLLEHLKIISPSEGQKPRQILVTEFELGEILENLNYD